MLEEIIEAVARILTAIFKKRPYIAFFIFLGLFVIGLSIWILIANTQEERLFPIIALGFVMVVLAWYTRLVIKRWDIIKNQTYPEPERPAAPQPEMVAADQAASATTAASSASTPAAFPVPSPEVQPVQSPAAFTGPVVASKPSTQALHLILGAVAAVFISAPLVLIASFGLGVSPLVAEEEVEGFAIVVGILLCLLIPVAAGLGALFGAIFTRRAKQRTTARLNGTALFAGGTTGFILGLLAMAAFYFLVSTPA